MLKGQRAGFSTSWVCAGLRSMRVRHLAASADRVERRPGFRRLWHCRRGCDVLRQAAIAGRDGGPSELVTHGRTGLVLEGGDGRAVAIALRQLRCRIAQAHEAGAARPSIVAQILVP